MKKCTGGRIGLILTVAMAGNTAISGSTSEKCKVQGNASHHVCQSNAFVSLKVTGPAGETWYGTALSAPSKACILKGGAGWARDGHAMVLWDSDRDLATKIKTLDVECLVSETASYHCKDASKKAHWSCVLVNDNDGTTNVHNLACTCAAG